MTLIKTSLLTAISTIIRAIAELIINKVIAVYAGPSGLAIVGQLQSFVSSITSLSNGGITNGVIKYTAEYNNFDLKQKIFSTSIIISLICSLFTSIILIIFSDFFSTYILKTIDYKSVFILFGITIFLYSTNSILLSILNAQKEIKKYILVNIASSIVSLILVSTLVIKLELIGALYALVLNQSIVFFVTLSFILKSNWFKLKYFTSGINKDSLIKLGHYSLMAIATAISVPVSHMIIRDYLGSNLSWDEVGYWQAIWYISSMYLLIINISLKVYYLPKLSELTDKKELKQEILSGYKIILPIISVMIIFIYLFKEYIVLLAFSEKFMPVVELFLWQLLGDFIKITSLLLGYLLIAKSMTKIFVYMEIGFSILFVLFSILFVNTYGLIGVIYGYVLVYFIHLIVLFIITKRYLHNDF